MSTQTHTKREKGQALFLSALMVLSVFAMSAAFAGAAAADEHEPVKEELDDMDLYQGQEIEITDLVGSTVEVHEGTSETGDVVHYLRAQNDHTLDVDELETGPHVIVDDEGTYGPFWVNEHTADIEFDSETVAQTSTSLNYESDRSDDVTLEVSSDELDGDDLQDVFGDEYNTDDDVITITEVSPGDNVGADFSDVDTGEYNFTVTVADTTVEEDLSIEVTEAVEDGAQFDSSTYSQTAGDIAEFTVEMEGDQDSAVVSLEDEDGGYWADVLVTADDGEDEVTVEFNTFEAGQDEPGVENDAFSSEDGTVNVLDERDFTTDDDGETVSEYRLLPSALDMQLYVGDDTAVDNVTSSDPATDEDDRLDLSGFDEVDVATLFLEERSIGDIDSAIAPAGSLEDLDDDVDDLNEISTAGDEVAEDDYFVVGTGVNGVFGYLDGLAENDLGDSLDLEIEQSNPDRYDSPDNVDNFNVIVDSENDQLFFVIDTEAEGLEAGAEYDVTFSVDEEYVEYYAENGADDEELETSFSVIDRDLEVTGDLDDEDRVQVENSEEANVTGESTAAAGTDVQVNLRATGDDPFHLTQTGEVDEDGVIDADFDLSGHEEGQDFTITMTDRNGAGDDVDATAEAVLVESADDHDQDPHPVTVTVTDADGEPVEDADVEIDGQTETTDSNGEATFELQHGEYDVSATHDGESASGTVTVDDESSDTGSLTLGEEDAGEINDPADDADDGVDDEDDDTGVDDDDATDADDDDATDDDAADTDDDDDPEDEEQPGFGIAVALIALLAAAGIALRNRA
ncbi:carboxypeptidase-like regulatory domain-containing protein [Halalkalicoccus tibetensis]|uniref:Carboxypeptidase-like regulatory domain-containing protein n=1 Tax=Halalkalicoccus tibetensis TaxID=175632 RepID=A0ABD5V0W9_9EURY